MRSVIVAMIMLAVMGIAISEMEVEKLFDKAEEVAYSANIKNIERAIELYKFNEGKLPETEEELERYLDKELNEIWDGVEYRLEDGSPFIIIDGEEIRLQIRI